MRKSAKPLRKLQLARNVWKRCRLILRRASVLQICAILRVRCSVPFCDNFVSESWIFLPVNTKHLIWVAELSAISEKHVGWKLPSNPFPRALIPYRISLRECFFAVAGEQEQKCRRLNIILKIVLLKHEEYMEQERMKTEVHEVKLILKNCMASKSRQEQELRSRSTDERIDKFYSFKTTGRAIQTYRKHTRKVSEQELTI